MKKLATTRLVSWVIVSFLFFSIIIGTTTAQAVSYTKDVYTTENIQAICNDYNFAKGKYWTYSTSSGNSTAYTASNYKGKTTSSPSGAQGDYVGYRFAGGQECYAFAAFIGYCLSGDRNPYSDWDTLITVDDVNATGGLRVGDIVQSPSHYAIVYSVLADGSVRFAQCYGSVNNYIGINEGFAAGSNMPTTLKGIRDIYGLCKVYRSPRNLGNPFAVYTSQGSSNNGWYRVISGSGNLKEYPYSDADTKKTVSVNPNISALNSNNVLEVVETVKNSYGNIWVKLSNGYFAYLGDLELLFTKEESVSITATTTQKNWHRYPFSDAHIEYTMSGNSQSVNLQAKYKNKYGNIWYQTVDSSGAYFINEDNLSNMQNNVTITIQGASAGNSSNPKGYPTGNLNQGVAFELCGTISASENLARVEGHVINASTGAHALPIAVVTPNAKTLNIQKSNINYNLIFNNLPAGSYIYYVIATTFSGVTKRFFDSNFTVGSVVSVSGVSLNKSRLDLCVGDTGVLTATVSPSNATNKNLTWKSSNTNVATVSNGRVVAEGTGTATITVTTADGNKTASCTVSVIEIEETPYIDMPSSLMITLGQQEDLYATTSNGSTISWSSSDSGTVKVTSDGYIIGLLPGSAVITATLSSDSSISAQCVVYVVSPNFDEGALYANNQPTSVSISGSSYYRVKQYHFVAPTTAYYHFYTTGSSDSYGALFDANWNLISKNDDGGSDHNFSITSLLTEGSLYYVLARNYYVSGDFNTSIYAEYSSDGSVSVDELWGVAIDVQGLNSFHSFVPTRNTTYAFMSSMAGMDTYGCIYDSNYNLLASNDDGGYDNNFCVKYNMIAGQTYYLGCRFYSSTTTGSFNCKVCEYVPVEGFWVYLNELLPGESKAFSAYVYPDNATIKQVYYSSLDDCSTASINYDGWTEGISNGVVKTTAYLKDNPSITTDALVLVHDPVQIEVINNYAFVNSNDDVTIYLDIQSVGSYDDYVDEYQIFINNEANLLDWLNVSYSPGTGASAQLDYFSSDNERLILYVRDKNNANGLSVNNTIYTDLRIRNDKMAGLWGTTKTITFDTIYPIYVDYENNTGYPFRSNLSCPYSVTIAFPEEPTPLNAADFTIPSATKIIEEEAFYGIAAKRVKLPEGITEIGPRAFSFCQNLKGIYIPSSCTSIATNAFSYVYNLKIYGKSGSYAETYANSRGFTFIAVN